MPSTVDRFSFCRMTQSGSAFVFALDAATVTASSAASGMAVANVKSFSGSGVGPWWRSTGATSEWIAWDRGGGTLSALKWFHVAGAASWGTLDANGYTIVLTLKTGTTSGVSDGLNLALTHSAITGDWYQTFAADTNRYVKLEITAGAGNGIGYFQVARVTGDTFETVDVNFVRGMTEVPRNGTSELVNAHGSVAHRYVHPLAALSIQFAYVGGDDIGRFDRLVGYAGASRGAYAPETPLWACPDPSLTLGAGRFAPRFCRIVGETPFTGTDAAGARYSTPLNLLQVGK